MSRRAVNRSRSSSVDTAAPVVPASHAASRAGSSASTPSAARGWARAAKGSSVGDSEGLLERRRSRTRRVLGGLRLLMLGVLIALVTVFAVVSYRELQEDEDQRLAEQFTYVAEGLLANMNRTLLVAATFTSSVLGNGFTRELLTLPQFLTLTSGSTDPTLSAFLGVSFNPLVYPGDRAELEQRARAIDYSNLAEPPVPAAQVAAQLALGIWRRNATGERAPSAPNAPFYVPVLYMSPLRANLPAILFDIYSEPTRRAAVDQAMQTRRATLTDIITLVQSEGNRAASLLLSPVLDELTGNVTGFIVAAVSYDRVLEEALPSFVPGLELHLRGPASAFVFEISDTRVIRQRFNPEPPRGRERLSVHGTVTAGVNFSVSIYPTDRFTQAYQTNTPVVTAVLVAVIGAVPLLLFVTYDALTRRYTKAATQHLRDLLAKTQEPHQDWAQQRKHMADMPLRLDATPLEIDLHRVTFIELVSEGTFSTVYKGLLANDHGARQPVAIKILHAQNREVGLQEALLWAQLSNPHIQPFLGIVTQLERLLLLSPFCENGTLEHLLHSRPGYTSTERLEIALQVGKKEI